MELLGRRSESGREKTTTARGVVRPGAPRAGGVLVDDDRYMDEAFELAERGRGRTHPNPLVGAVLVRDDEVVGRG